MAAGWVTEVTLADRVTRDDEGDDADEPREEGGSLALEES
jgi:hypothetical protein